MSAISPVADPAAGVVLVGHGPHKVLCLHGWFGSAQGWGGWPALLDGERFTYAFLDYRGYGARKAVKGEHTFDEIAADALAVADALGFERFSLIGHSMGGAAAARVLSLAPDRVQKLVGLAPVAASGVPFDAAGYAWFASATEDLGARRGILDLTTGNRLTGTWLDQMVAHSVAHSTPEAFAGCFVAWAKGGFAEAVQGLATPTLVVVGAHDPAIGADYVAQTWSLQLPGTQVEVMANAGHYPMFETPIALATVVEKFLSA